MTAEIESLNLVKKSSSGKATNFNSSIRSSQNIKLALQVFLGSLLESNVFLQFVSPVVAK